MRKLVLVGVLAVAGFVLCAGTALASGKKEAASSKAPAATSSKTTLHFANWVSAEAATRKNIETVIAAFEKDNPQVTVDNIPIPFDQMHQQLLIQTAGGDPPEVMQLNGPWPMELGGVGALADLSKYASKEFLADNWKGGLQAGEYKGVLYAIPFGLTPHGFWWNKKLFAQAGLNPNDPPKTMDQLISDIKVLKAKLPSDVYPIGLDTTKISYALTEFWPWILTYGGRPMYNGNDNFDTAPVRKAFDFLQTAAKEGWTPVGQQIKDERELMAKGKIVMKLDGPYLVGILRSLNPSLAGDAFFQTFGVTTVPVGVPGESPVTLADIHQLGMSKQAKQPEMAWKFMKFLVSSPLSVKVYQVPYGLIPSLKSTFHDYPGLYDNPVAQEYAKAVIPSMIGGPYNPQYDAAGSFIIRGMQEVALTGAPVDKVLKEITANLQTLYGK